MVDVDSLALTHSGQAVTARAREKFDAIFLLSAAHRKVLPEFLLPLISAKTV